jgi:hypothetical protein
VFESEDMPACVEMRIISIANVGYERELACMMQVAVI